MWAVLSSIMKTELGSDSGPHPTREGSACLGRGRGCGAQCDDARSETVRRQEAPVRQQAFGRSEPAFVIVARIAVAAADLGDEALLELLPAEVARVGEAHDRGEDAGLPGRIEARPAWVARQVERRRERHRASR